MSISLIDQPFHDHYQSLLKSQKDIFEQLSAYPFDLSKREVTDAILARSDTFWGISQGMNELLGRKKNITAAEFFAENCLFFIKAIVEKQFGNKYEVKSEAVANKIRSKNQVRPDISIWEKENERMIGVIEIKTSIDWMRHNWREHLEHREQHLKVVSENPDLFFAVIMLVNQFDESVSDFNSKYFGLRNYRRDSVTPTNATIEKLMLEFMKSQEPF